jgi:hypothetical protein
MIDMNNSRLHESIKTGYAKFIDFLAELRCEELAQPGVIGHWSIKDITAHISVHEQRMVQWIKERLQGNDSKTPQPYDMPADELDQLNEQIYQENCDRSLDDILREFDRIHVETLKLVGTVIEKDIFDVSRFRLLGGEPLWEAIAANTFWHYEEHSQDILRWQVAKHSTVTRSLSTRSR